MKQLAQEGRTIICTIHQPSALVFGLFDHLYALAEGQCIYTGNIQMLVPFLAELNLVCPKTYNPSDYLLEISTHDYGEENSRLVEKIQNGKNMVYRVYQPSSAQIYSLDMAGEYLHFFTIQKGEFGLFGLCLCSIFRKNYGKWISNAS